AGLAGRQDVKRRSPQMFCPYCAKEKSVSEFTDEHVLPQSMCGALQPTNPFKLAVCRPCNNFCGEHVDGPASGGFLGQLARSSAASISDTGEVTPPIVPIGRI